MDLVKIWLDFYKSHQNLAGSQWILSKSDWISTDLVEIWPDLAKFATGERRSLVESVGLGFSCEDPPTDLPDSIFENENLTPTATGSRSNGFWSGSDDLSRWIRSQVSMDSPKRCSAPKVYIGPL